jgi:hypothetical protein
MLALTERIRDRDLRQVWLYSEDRMHHGVPFERWKTNHHRACIAPLIDKPWTHPVIPCGGRDTNEHVTPGYGRMRAKARDRLEEMLTLCWNHHLELWAGYNWATANKEAERDYLKRMHPKYYEALSRGEDPYEH